MFQQLAVADRTRKNTFRFPHCYERATRVRIEKRSGKSIDFKPENCAYQCAGNETVYAQLLPGAKPEHKFAFYELKDVGGILVHFSSDGVAMTEGVIYLSVDDGFVTLKNKNDLNKRLAWEATKIRLLRKWLAIPENIVKDKAGNFILDSGVSGERSSVQTDPRVRVIYDYGLMGQME